VRPLDPRLLRRARGVSGSVCVAGALGTVAAVATVVQAAMIAQLVASVFLDGADLADLRGPLIMLVAASMVRGVVAWQQEALAAGAAARVKRQLRGQLLRHVLDLGPSWLAERRTGELAQLATRGLDSLDAYLTRYLPQLVIACVVPPIVLVCMGISDPLSALIVLVTLPLLPVFGALVGWTTQRRTARQWTALQRLSHHFLDVLDGLPVLRVYRRGRAQAASIAAVTDEYRRSTLAVLRVSFLSSFVLELAATLSVALVAVSVGLRLDSGSLGLQSGLFVLILAPEAYLPLRQLAVHYHAAAEGVAAAGRVLDVLDEPLPADGTAPAPDFRGAGLSVEDVQVRYPERAALPGATLRVRPGELVAVVGPSGCGKSTLLAAVLGNVAVTAGRIRVGGADLADVSRTSWLAQLAWLPQRPVLLAGTVADNVRLGVADATDAEVRAALTGAGAADLDPGVLLAEDGTGLSAGQRQRVALARALLRCSHGAGLLLLDEPTEHLDRATEAVVLRTLRAVAHDPSRPCGVLMVAHRESAAQAADRVVRLDAVQGGTPAGRPVAPAAVPPVLDQSMGTVESRPDRYFDQAEVTVDQAEPAHEASPERAPV
jgi:ATP-binding cassette subfamily C protein CydCD